jgi:anti-anti-sigma regulatory factor
MLPNPAPLRVTPLEYSVGWRLAGEVDISTVRQLIQILEAIPRTGSDVHLDLAELEFIDVQGAEAVVAAAGDLDDGRHLVLHDPPHALTRILSLCRHTTPNLRVRLSVT